MCVSQDPFEGSTDSRLVVEQGWSQVTGPFQDPQSGLQPVGPVTRGIDWCGSSQVSCWIGLVAALQSSRARATSMGGRGCFGSVAGTMLSEPATGELPAFSEQLSAVLNHVRWACHWGMYLPSQSTSPQSWASPGFCDLLSGSQSSHKGSFVHEQLPDHCLCWGTWAGDFLFCICWQLQPFTFGHKKLKFSIANIFPRLHNFHISGNKFCQIFDILQNNISIKPILWLLRDKMIITIKLLADL